MYTPGGTLSILQGYTDFEVNFKADLEEFELLFPIYLKQYFPLMNDSNCNLFAGHMVKKQNKKKDHIFNSI